ncbi:MAG: RdgB/HAM1 family non-canonical purine NTP pyrophosphatase [Polyangiales bacterium]
MSGPRVVLATGNAGKREEFAAMLPDLVLLTLRDIGIDDIPEPHADFVRNAAVKARACATRSGMPALADDSGLAVDALLGAPGVFSARFGGAHGDDAGNRRRLVDALRGVPDARRGARFRCVLVLADPHGPLGDALLVAQGIVEGHITTAPRGHGGFGYDPLFVPLGSSMTLAEMSDGEKAARSHRGRAVRALGPALRSYLLRRA